MSSPLVLPDAGWRLTLYPSAREAGYSFQSSVRAPRMYVPPGFAANPERARAEAARRARGRVRRYGAANLLDRMGTLTYGGEGQFDPVAGRADVAACFRRMRSLLGGEPFAYLWVPEWHPGGHGLHFHFGVGQYVRKTRIEEAWGNGHVHIGQKSIRHGATRLDRARTAAAYLSKYVSKTFESEDLGGRHRYEVAQGFQPSRIGLVGTSEAEVLAAACDRMGGYPARQWDSADAHAWQGPPAGWVQWD